MEELHLIDQPKLVSQPRSVQEDQQCKAHVFQGLLRLSAQEAKALARCVMILDAVIRHRDHSSATLHAWREKAPLKSLLKRNNGNHPALQAVAFESQHGITLDFENVLSELVDIWSEACGRNLDPGYTRSLISRYFPVAFPIRKHEQMTNVFETARKYVADKDISQS